MKAKRNSCRVDSCRHKRFLELIVCIVLDHSQGTLSKFEISLPVHICVRNVYQVLKVLRLRLNVKTSKDTSQSYMIGTGGWRVSLHQILNQVRLCKLHATNFFTGHMSETWLYELT